MSTSVRVDVTDQGDADPIIKKLVDFGYDKSVLDQISAEDVVAQLCAKNYSFTDETRDPEGIFIKTPDDVDLGPIDRATTVACTVDSSIWRISSMKSVFVMPTQSLIESVPDIDVTDAASASKIVEPEKTVIMLVLGAYTDYSVPENLLKLMTIIGRTAFEHVEFAFSTMSGLCATVHIASDGSVLVCVKSSTIISPTTTDADIQKSIHDFGLQIIQAGSQVSAMLPDVVSKVLEYYASNAASAATEAKKDKDPVVWN